MNLSNIIDDIEQKKEQDAEIAKQHTEIAKQKRMEFNNDVATCFDDHVIPVLDKQYLSLNMRVIATFNDQDLDSDSECNEWYKEVSLTLSRDGYADAFISFTQQK
ncbi:MAG: hypothetical protein GY754_21170 [bacterium]|nr:hypothetical protein [bacterium]